MKKLLLAMATIAFVSGCGGSSGNSTPPVPQVTDQAPVDNTPPADQNALDAYDGMKLAFTSDDQTCTSQIELFTNGSDLTVQDFGPCRVLFKQTFTLHCHTDGDCVGRIDYYRANVTAKLVDAHTLQFTVQNDLEPSAHVTTYTASQQ